MKKVLTAFIAILGFAGLANAQSTTASTNNTAAPVTAITETTGETNDEASCYCCPKGDYCSTQPGTCALHYNINLVKDGEFYCPVIDNVTGSTEGYCPGTGKEMKKMEANNCKGGLNMEKKVKDRKKEKGKENEGNSGSPETETQTGK